MRFLDIGTALQGLNQGYQQQQQSSLQRAIQQLALQKQQREDQAKGLAFQALAGGALGNQKPLANFSPQGPVPGLPPPPPTTAPQPGPVPPTPAADDSGVSIIPGSAVHAIPSATAAGSGNTAPVPPLPASGAALSPADAITQEKLPPPASPAPVPPAMSPTSSADTATAAPSPEVSAQPDISQFLHTVDPAHIAQRIMQMKPGLDPATAMLATEELYKMATAGSQLERAQTAALLKYAFPTANFVLGEQGRDTRQNKTIRAAEQRQDKSIAAAGQRQDKTISAANARAQQRLSAQQYEQALRRASGNQKAQLSELHRQLGDLDRRINQVMNVNTTDPQLPGLVQQRNALADREKAMGEKLLDGAAQQ